jgi:hypothetical protein
LFGALGDKIPAVMKSYYLVTAGMGLCLAIAILYLVRRDHIYIRDGLFWIVVAGVSLVLSLWPGLIDTIGGAMGISYPPALLFLVAIVVLVLRSLMADLALTQVRRDLRRLNQKVALLHHSSPNDHEKRCD